MPDAIFCENLYAALSHPIRVYVFMKDNGQTNLFYIMDCLAIFTIRACWFNHVPSSLHYILSLLLLLSLFLIILKCLHVEIHMEEGYYIYIQGGTMKSIY